MKLEDITLADLMERVEEEGGCLLWTRAAFGVHPRWRVDDAMVPARRVVYELVHGRIRKGRQIGLTCDNPLCVHPDHLVARTRSQANLAARPRAITDHITVALARRRGAKVDDAKVREIRTSPAPAPVIAAALDISTSYVNQIRRGEAWRDFSSPLAQLRRA